MEMVMKIIMTRTDSNKLCTKGHGRMAFPTDYRTQEFLTQLAMDRDGTSETWVGLDGRSDPNNHQPTLTPLWTKSDGEVASEIRWAAGAPLQNASQQCVFMDHASGG